MKLVKYGLSKAFDVVMKQNLPRSIEIEVCSACNHRCVYCPVYDDPFRQKVMAPKDFSIILDKLEAIPHIKRIGLNHYNEPFMDPHISERIHEIFARNITRWVILYTNASMIKPEHYEAFLPYRKSLGFNINLPTVVNEERYKEIHGRNDLKKVLHAINQLIKYDYLVQINVQGNHHTTEEDFKSVVKMFGDKVKKIQWIKSSTRSNLTLDKTYHHKGKIIGCTLFRHTNYLHIGVNGDVFLCAEDFHKKSQFANLLSDSLETVLNAPKRKAYLAYLSGKQNAPKSFICRSCKHAIIEENTGWDWVTETMHSNNLLNKF